MCCVGGSSICKSYLWVNLFCFFPRYFSFQQWNCFSSTMNIHNFAKYPTERRGSSTMLVASGWLGMQQQYPKALSLISWMKAFPRNREFAFSCTVDNCETWLVRISVLSIICTQQATNELTAYQFTRHNSNIEWQQLLVFLLVSVLKAWIYRAPLMHARHKP